MSEEQRNGNGPPGDAPRDEPEWMTVTEAANKIGYTRQQIYNLVNGGFVRSRPRSSGDEVFMPDVYDYLNSDIARGPRHNPDEL